MEGERKKGREGGRKGEGGTERERPQVRGFPGKKRQKNAYPHFDEGFQVLSLLPSSLFFSPPSLALPVLVCRRMAWYILLLCGKGH